MVLARWFSQIRWRKTSNYIHRCINYKAETQSTTCSMPVFNEFSRLTWHTRRKLFNKSDLLDCSILPTFGTSVAFLFGTVDMRALGVANWPWSNRPRNRTPLPALALSGRLQSGLCWFVKVFDFVALLGDINPVILRHFHPFVADRRATVRTTFFFVPMPCALEAQTTKTCCLWLAIPTYWRIGEKKS